jgi:hypothetical protein
LHNPPANGKQGLIPEEMSHTLLTKKSMETWTKYTPVTLLTKPTQTRNNSKKYTFCVTKSLKHLKEIKTGRVPYLGIELI